MKVLLPLQLCRGLAMMHDTSNQASLACRQSCQDFPASTFTPSPCALTRTHRVKLYCIADTAAEAQPAPAGCYSPRQAFQPTLHPHKGVCLSWYPPWACARISAELCAHAISDAAGPAKAHGALQLCIVVADNLVCMLQTSPGALQLVMTPLAPLAFPPLSAPPPTHSPSCHAAAGAAVLRRTACGGSTSS